MGKKSINEKIIPKNEFILLSEVLREAKEKFEGWNLRSQLYSYVNLQSKIYKAASDVRTKNKVEVKHKLALMLINGIDYVYSKEARN